MSVDDVEKALRRIKRIRADDETAHMDEDDLHVEVLEAIAAGECADPVALAREALKSREIDFARWCA